MWARSPSSQTVQADAGQPASAVAVRGVGNQARLRRLSAAAGLQPKLEIGAVDDPLEREADEAADRVMAMPDPGSIPISPAPPRLSRKCEGCEEEEAT